MICNPGKFRVEDCATPSPYACVIPGSWTVADIANKDFESDGYRESGSTNRIVLMVRVVMKMIIVIMVIRVLTNNDTITAAAVTTTNNNSSNNNNW